MSRHLTICLAAVLLPLFGPQQAVAAPDTDYFLGEPWEAALVRGVQEQRRAEKRRTPVETILGRAERAARRDDSVAKLYLLARAYGLRAQWQWNRSQDARDPAARQKARANAVRDRASALATYRDVLRRAPRCYFAHHDMGIMAMLQEQPDTRTAFTHFSNAYTLNRRYTPSQRQLIKLYVDGKQYREAIPVLRRLLQLEPEDEKARWLLITALGQEKRYEEAYREVERILAREPSQPRALAMCSFLDVQTGRFERAIANYKRLARLNPNVPTAFVGILECVKQMETRKLKVDLEDYLFALKGVKRLIREPAERKRIEEQVRRVEHAMAAPPGGAKGAPPTTAQLLHALEHPEEGMRIYALKALLVREEPATPEVVRAVARHINEAAEPSPAVRGGAVRALGRMSGTVLVPLLRLKLEDSALAVRRETADTLVGIATRDARAADAILVILGLYVRATDVPLASSARQGILQLAAAVLPGVGEDSDDAAHRRAFETWWRSAEGENVLIEALDAYHRIGDRAAYAVLLPYLEAPSFHVFHAAYRALGRAGATAGDAGLRRWHAAMPRFPADRMNKGNWADLKRTLAAWVARRPGS